MIDEAAVLDREAEGRDDSLLSPAPSQECAAAPSPQHIRSLSVTDGARAELCTSPGVQTLRLYAPDGGLLFEYDTRSKRGRAYAPGGHLEVSADTGELSLSAAKRIRLRSATVEIEAGRLITAAGIVCNRIENLYQEVQGVTQLVTGRLRTLVSGAWQSKCRRAYIKADEDVKINGSQIHLG